jgi:hypothetical protein
MFGGGFCNGMGAGGWLLGSRSFTAGCPALLPAFRRPLPSISTPIRTRDLGLVVRYRTPGAAAAG